MKWDNEAIRGYPKEFNAGPGFKYGFVDILGKRKMLPFFICSFLFDYFVCAVWGLVLGSCF